jgi:thimet oligopeptidase
MNGTSAGALTLVSGADAFAAAAKEAMAEARAAIERLKALPAGAPVDAVLEAYDRATLALVDAGARASVCRNAHPESRMRDTADECERDLDALATELSLDRGVYDALAALDLSAADPATRHYVQKTLRELKRSGVDRDEATRAQVKLLKDELVRIGQEFGKHIIEDVRHIALQPEQLDGLPEDYRRAHPPGEDGQVSLSTDNTDYVPFITYARDAAARERYWRLYRLRGHPLNLGVLDRMLRTRHQLATLLGYPSWAAYATEDKMIGSAENAADFIARITAASTARAARDYAQLLQRKRKEAPQASEVAAWDSAYYQDRVAAEEYGFDSQAVRPYFEYGRVKAGVLAITGRMFGLSYRPVHGTAVWHPDVEVYDVIEGADVGGARALGRIYLDMHPREGKYKHYAQFVLTTGRSAERLPEGVLLCNFPRPGGDAPALMEHDGVRTFFHEFGHLLHHVLGGHTRWAGVSGVATEWDFVEAPSQMLEEWVWDTETLQTFARHVDTGAPIPAALVDQARRADQYGKGLWVRQQMFYAAVSLELHLSDPRALDTTRKVAELQDRYTPFRYVPGTFFQASFGHLAGYSAVYYTYMWSLVIAKDLFSVFTKEGLLAPDPAARYRRAVLEPGGSRPAAELVRDFLARPYDFAAYQAWLDGA